MPSVRCSPPLNNPRIACARESGSPEFLAQQLAKLPQDLTTELWLSAEAELRDLTVEAFSETLAAAAEKFNCDLPSGMIQGTAERASFLRGLRLAGLDLAATFQSRVQEYSDPDVNATARSV